MLSNYFIEELQSGSLKSLPIVTERFSHRTTTSVNSNKKLQIENIVDAIAKTDIAEESNEVKLNGPVLEEWLNTVLKQDSEDQQVPKNLRHSSQNKLPSQLY